MQNFAVGVFVYAHRGHIRPAGPENVGGGGMVEAWGGGVEAGIGIEGEYDGCWVLTVG